MAGGIHKEIETGISRLADRVRGGLQEAGLPVATVGNGDIHPIPRDVSGAVVYFLSRPDNHESGVYVTWNGAPNVTEVAKAVLLEAGGLDGMRDEGRDAIEFLGQVGDAMNNAMLTILTARKHDAGLVEAPDGTVSIRVSRRETD